jgi:hypothetical protein
LKELKGVAERGRLISGAGSRAGFVRLVKASYVTERAVSLDALLYSITALGRHALDNMTIESWSLRRFVNELGSRQLKRPYHRFPMSDDEAKGFVEEKLRKQQTTKPMTETEMTRFCDAMLRYLELPSKRALSDIRGWAESWQAKWFQTEKPPAT